MDIEGNHCMSHCRLRFCQVHKRQLFVLTGERWPKTGLANLRAMEQIPGGVRTIFQHHSGKDPAFHLVTAVAATVGKGNSSRADKLNGSGKSTLLVQHHQLSMQTLEVELTGGAP